MLDHRALWRRFAACSVLPLALLAGCGGGGGGGAEPLPPISGTYNLDALAEVGVASSIQAQTTSGTSGTLSCTHDGGTLPPGMVLQAGCTLAGTPTSVGIFESTITLRASGNSGQITVRASVRIGGPVLGRAAAEAVTLELSAPQVARPLVTLQALHTYTPRPGDVITYALASGSLPRGLSLDATTGQIAGTPTALGDSTLTLGATLARGGVSVTMTPLPFTLTVQPPPTTPNYGCCVQAAAAVALTSAAPIFIPALPAGASAQFEAVTTLPAGLAVAPATGAITGRTLLPGTYPVRVRARVTTAEGVEFTTPEASLTLQVSGIAPYYGQASQFVGEAPGSVSHRLARSVGGTLQSFPPGTVYGGLAGDSYSFELVAHPASGAVAPAWLRLDAGTGVLTATTPDSMPLSAVPVQFAVRITTRRGADVIVTTQPWDLYYPL